MLGASVSVVITAYDRAQLLSVTLASIRAQHRLVELVVVEDGDDGGPTRDVCLEYGAAHLQRLTRPPVAYSNQACVINRGIKYATGDVIILQNAECYHQGEVIATLLEDVHGDNAVYATCAALNADATFSQWYCHPLHNRRPYFFCGAMTRANFVRLGGFEESFTAYGFEDDDFAERLTLAGIKHEWSHASVLHQWHLPYSGDLTQGADHLRELQARRTSYVANQGREWGLTP